MTENDRVALQAIAKDMNDGIIAEEGYDPVGEAWIMRALADAFEIGRVSMARQEGLPVMVNELTVAGRPSDRITE